MPKPFYNSTETDLASGAANLISIVTPVPATYGLTSAIVTDYTAKATSFQNLLNLTIEPLTRTPVAIADKKAAKQALTRASVNVARIITATPTVTDGQLVSLRLNERPTYQPRPVPEIPPTIDIVSVLNRLAIVRVHDSATERRGLPFGATGANLYSYVGPVPPTDPRAYHFEGMTTRSKGQILFPDTVPSGSTVWLCAAWVSARGQTSFASTPISFTLQGGPISAAA